MSAHTPDEESHGWDRWPVATTRRITYLCAWVVSTVAVVIPGWAMGTDSPVVTWWIRLTLALWGLALAVGLVFLAIRSSRSTGVAIILATIAGAMTFVLLYMAAFSLGDWD
jgi:hypothetical protein